MKRLDDSWEKEYDRRFADGGELPEDPVRDGTNVVNPERERVEKFAQMNTGSHGFRMEHDPVYAQEWESRGKKTAAIYGGVDYPKEDMRSTNYTGNPNSVFSGGMTGALAAGTEDFNSALISSFLPLPGLGAPSEIRTSKQLYNSIKSGPKRFLTKDELGLLRSEQGANGILDVQKTPNLPWKEPIREIIHPYGYDNYGGVLQETRIKDAISYLKNEKLKLTPNESNNVNWTLEQAGKTEMRSREAYKFLADRRLNPLFESVKSRNRFATFNQYLGKPIKEHPLYDISSLSTNKDVVYTIKPGFIDKEKAQYKINELFDELKQLPEREEYIAMKNREPGETGHNWRLDSDMTVVRTGENTFTRQGTDQMFGTMGGMDWDIELMPNGKYKVIARDVWDLQPFKNGIEFKYNGGGLPYKLKKKASELVVDMEAGKAAGIGKPLNVKVGFIVDPNTKKILKTFGVAPVAAGAVSESKENKEPEYEDTWY